VLTDEFLLAVGPRRCDRRFAYWTVVTSALLRNKLRRIEALFAGAATAGKKAAAGAAAERIRARLRVEEKRAQPGEIRFSLPDPRSRQMFIALC
jgi:hypothetical protein